MKKEKRDIILAWDEADEVLEDLAFSDEVVLETLPAIRQRMFRIAELLQDKFSVDEYNEVFKQEIKKTIWKVKKNGKKLHMD